MNREQKAAAVAEIADADPGVRGRLRGRLPRHLGAAGRRACARKLREADATFRVVKNSLTERAADEADADVLKPLLEGPTALTFVRGDAAVAAKALATFGRQTDLLAFKGGMLNGDALDADQIRSISQLPARDVLYGQLVGMVASPITGLVRGLNALIQGIALAARPDRREEGVGRAARRRGSGRRRDRGSGRGRGAETPAEPETPAEAEAPAEDAPTDTDDNEADASAQADDAEATQED